MAPLPSHAVIALGCARYVNDKLQEEVVMLRYEREELRLVAQAWEESTAVYMAEVVRLEAELAKVRELAWQRGVQRDALLSIEGPPRREPMDDRHSPELDRLFGETWEQYVEGYIEDHRNFPDEE
jgi:GGDEF domain-containing protein